MGNQVFLRKTLVQYQLHKSTKMVSVKTNLPANVCTKSQLTVIQGKVPVLLENLPQQDFSQESDSISPGRQEQILGLSEGQWIAEGKPFWCILLVTATARPSGGAVTVGAQKRLSPWWKLGLIWIYGVCEEIMYLFTRKSFNSAKVGNPIPVPSKAQKN